MSVVAALSEEPAPCVPLTNHEREIITPVKETVITAVNESPEAIKTEIIQPLNSPEKLTHELAELTNTTNNDETTATSDCQLLTNSAIKQESLSNSVEDSASEHTFENLEHSTSGDYQLIIPSDDQQEPTNEDNDDQQHATDNIAVQEQPSNNTHDVGHQPTTESVASDTTVNPQSPVSTIENDQPSENQEVAEVEKPKSESNTQIPLYIPPHLMGRDLNNPAQDVVGSNRRIPKPRLGVKVPYRNLMSQIVTQDEIAQEILERQMRKYSYPEAIEGGDIFFAMKLTHRLANKITPNESSEKKQLESTKLTRTKIADIIKSTVSDSPSKSTSQNVMENSSTLSIAVTSSTNVVSSIPSGDTTLISNASGVSTVTTANSVVQPALEAASQLRSKKDSSPADELYAEISSTLKENCHSTAIPVQISATELQADQSNAKSQIPSTVNGSAPVHTEAELDNDTLLAILEGTTDVNESCAVRGDVSVAGPVPTASTVPVANAISTAAAVSTTSAVPVADTVPTRNAIPPAPQTAIITSKSALEGNTKKRKKRIRPILDPDLEKELALKQLMAFESKKRVRKPNTSAATKSKTATPATPQNGVIVASKNANSVSAKQTRDNKVADSSKKTKRVTNSYNISTQVPKRFPKKYQRIIKQQLRSSKRSKNQSPEQQKKLPEVPEVQIAIKSYIKTYASKRKHKPGSQSGEKPAEKKMKMDATEPNATAVAANAKVATSRAKTVATSAKAAAVSSKSATVNKSATISKSASVNKSVAANTRAAAANERASTEGTKAITTNAKSVAVDEKVVAAATTVAQQLASTLDAMEVNECEVVDVENNAILKPETAAELADKETQEVMAKSKANTKMMREINRLLGDEGAINMIYSVEQKRLPDSRRNTNVLPSARRQKKDLQLRTKLVKNAVLRLSMSSSSQGTPTRKIRRTSPERTSDAATTTVSAVAEGALMSATTATAALRKASIESVESNASELNNNNSSCSSTPRTMKTRQIAAEASRIIRRHSSSSAYSSDDEGETAGGSVEPSSLKMSSVAKSKEKITSSSLKTDEKATTTTSTVKINSSSECIPKSTSVKTTVPEKKSASKSSDNSKDKSPATSRRASKEAQANAQSNESHVLQDAPLNGTLGLELSEHQLSLKEITVRKYDNLVQIILISSSTKMKNALNIDILNELISVLRELEKDEGCRTVLVTSTGSSFCQGIDLRSLICADKAKRTKIVNEFVTTLMSFTKCLSQFRKILIAGVHGSAVGLGVTMLPFFDMVFASDKATFYTPYVKLGQIPEAGATLTLPHLLGNAVTSELLFGCRMLTASEALQFGLVTRTLWPDKFSEELLPLARGIASHSAKAMEATKLLLRQGMTAKLEEQLQLETNLLREHWCSEECQNSFKNYLEQEALVQNN